MKSPQQSLAFRLADRFLQLMLRFWPEGSRQWGQALAAELDEVEKPVEVLSWASGGLMLFVRASASNFLAWLRLPAGSGFSADSLSPELGSSMLPRSSRLFTVVILLATLLLLLLPQSRQAISTARASWHDYEISSADRHTLANLAAHAEQEKDARTLAFVALALPQPDRGMMLAERAVALDPSLTWIYASRFYRPDDSPQPQEWLARLHAYDPDNGFINLAFADAIAQPRYMALIAHGSITQQQFESAIVSDPLWVAQMEAAFHAPRYDGYLRKHWELISYAWNRDPSLSPSIIGYGLWSHQIPNILSLKTFTSFKVHRAQQARIDGHPEQAGKMLEEIDSFGKRMLEQGQTDIERLVALDLSRQAAQEWTVLYAATGREQEALQASARVQQLKELQRTFHSPSMAAYLTQEKQFCGYAILFQIATILVFLSALAVALSYLILELRPRASTRRHAIWQLILCRTADFAPASLFVACAACLISFLPFVHLFAAYRTQEGTNATFRSLSSTLWELVQFHTFFQNVFDRTLFWAVFTGALVLLAISILIRGFYRARPVAPISN